MAIAATCSNYSWSFLLIFVCSLFCRFQGHWPFTDRTHPHTARQVFTSRTLDSLRSMIAMWSPTPVFGVFEEYPQKRLRSSGLNILVGHHDWFAKKLDKEGTGLAHMTKAMCRFAAENGKFWFLLPGSTEEIEGPRAEESEDDES